jgi:CRISPR/Cas system-associated protein Csx1
MPKAKRSSAEVLAEKAKRDSDKEAKVTARQIAVQRIAAVEERMKQEDMMVSKDIHATAEKLDTTGKPLGERECRNIYCMFGLLN